MLSFASLEELFSRRKDIRFAFFYIRATIGSASIALARADDTDDPWLDSIYLPRLLIATRKHNIVLYRNGYYAAPHALGRLDFEKARDRRKLGVLEFESLYEARSYVRLCEKHEVELSYPSWHWLPYLMFQGRGHNIVHYRGRFYVAPQALGPLNLATERDRQKKGIADFDSLTQAVLYYITNTGHQVATLFAFGHERCSTAKELAALLAALTNFKVDELAPRRLFRFVNFQIISYRLRYVVCPAHYSPAQAAELEGVELANITSWEKVRYAFVACILSEIGLRMYWRRSHHFAKRYYIRFHNWSLSPDARDLASSRALARWLSTLRRRRHLGAVLTCAEMMELFGETAIANQLRSRARSLYPKTQDEALQTARLLDLVGLPDCAIAYLRQVGSGEDVSRKAAWFIARTRHKQHKWQERLRRLYAQHRVLPPSEIRDRLEPCSAYLSRDNLTEALRAATIHAPETAEEFEILGTIQQSARQWEKAIAAHLHAWKQSNAPDAMRMMGEAMLGAGKDGEIQKLFQREEGTSEHHRISLCDYRSARELCSAYGTKYMNLGGGERITVEFNVALDGVVRAARSTLGTPDAVVAELTKVEKLDGFSTLMVNGKHLVSEAFQEEPFIHAYRENFMYMRLINERRVLLSRPKKNIAELDEPCIHPVIGGQFNYYTWMVEILPRIALIEQLGLFSNLPYVFSGPMSGWQMETLDLMGITRDRVVSLEGLAPVYFERVYMPITSRYEIPNIPSLRRVREILGASALLGHGTTPGKRLYVSRAHQTQHRMLVNDEEISEWLVQQGFDIFRPEQFSVTEQIRIFSEAGAIVGPTGAWASNLIFANPEAKIMVFNPLDHIGLFFQLFASISGARFCSVIGTTLPSMLNDRPHWNYLVPLQNLKAAMSYLGVR